MRLRVGDELHRGDAVALPDWGRRPEALVAAVYGGAPVPRVELRCSAPGPGHARLARVGPNGVGSPRAAFAAAARSRGHEAPEREALATARRTLAELDAPDAAVDTPDLDDLRRRVADAGAVERRRRERVAELRGRLQALREAGADTEATAAELAEAVAALSETETDRVAAEQALAAAERAARTDRDRRERRLEREDRVRNLERAARASLSAAVADEMRAALDAVPGEGRLPDGPGSYEGDRLTAALAALRVADLDAPVVLAAGRFPDADAAASTLSVPVIRV
jgi:hypothetical protein